MGRAGETTLAPRSAGTHFSSDTADAGICQMSEPILSPMTGSATATLGLRRHLAAIIGGRPGPGGTCTAKHEYRLGCAWEDDTLLVVLLNGDQVNVGIAFQADRYDAAFARALAIAEDVADEAGHLSDGVLVSLTEFNSLAEIGIDAD